MRAYKYMRREHALRLVELGAVRVGTLDHYRASEDPLRGDRIDGGAIVGTPQHGAATGRDMHPRNRAIAWSTMGPVADGSMFVNCYFEAPELAPNCYVFCASWLNHTTAAGSYDACVLISDFKQFCRTLTPYIQGQLAMPARLDVRQVTYGSRNIDIADVEGVDPVFLKDSEPFAIEKEIRGAWRARAEPPSSPGYVDLVVPELRRFVRVEPIVGR